MKIIVRRNGLKGPILYEGMDMKEAIWAARDYDQYRHLTDDILGVRIIATLGSGLRYAVHNWRLGCFREEPEGDLIYDLLSKDGNSLTNRPRKRSTAKQERK